MLERQYMEFHFNLRQEKLRGCYIRSKMQWADEGEKPSFFFINLETNILQIKLFLNLLMKKQFSNFFFSFFFRYDA
jgi:hypothetical protein